MSYRHSFFGSAKTAALIALGLILGALMACGDVPEPTEASRVAVDATAESPSGVLVEAPRVVLAGDTAAFYVTLRSPAADRLLSVTTAAADRVDLHETVVENDVVRMVPKPEGFALSAGQPLLLEPMGRHGMLTAPDLEASRRVELTLSFETAGEVLLVAEVESGGMGHAAMDHSAMDHSSMDHEAMDHSAMDHGTTDHDTVDLEDTVHVSMEHADDSAEPDESSEAEISRDETSKDEVSEDEVSKDEVSQGMVG